VGQAGFGLTAVLRIARSYGGAIRVTGAEGQGTSFEVYFPVRPMAAGPVDDPVSMEAPSGGARVLVVEDDPAVLAIVNRALTRAGHAVITAGNAAEGLRIFDLVNPTFDLVVSDVILPDRPGPMMVASLRKRSPDLAVVYMSGYGEESLGLGDGEEITFLHKPFAPPQLLQAVQEALSRTSGDGTRPEQAEELD
jgi:DNA-binding NtrC family response regulator